MNEAFAQLKTTFLQELPAINAAIQREIDALPALVTRTCELAKIEPTIEA